jgi:hypothetical protein
LEAQKGARCEAVVLFLVHQACKDELGIGHLESGRMPSKDLKMNQIGNISLHNHDRALFSGLHVVCCWDGACVTKNAVRWPIDGSCFCQGFEIPNIPNIL